MTELRGNNIVVKAADTTLVDNVSVALGAGELVAILGPNGAGKTTLLRALLGLTRLASGTAQLDGRDSASLPASRRARLISYLPQRRPLAWPNRVRDIVALGRFAHGAAPGRLSPVDAEAVATALDACDLNAFADRTADSLSGGELARVHFARAIAARTPLLVADEPVAALDPLHQIQVAKLIRQFVDDGGGALVVLHDVVLAARIADRLIWMKGGKTVTTGTVEQTLNATTMAEVFGVIAQVDKDSHGMRVQIEGSA